MSAGNGNGVPAWLDALGVKSGDWYINTKARARRMMLNSLSSDARRIYACLELATMGFQQEMAVTMDGGKKRPLTPGDIANQTGMDRRKVANGLAELERLGLADRKASDGGALRKGRIVIYSFALPQPRTEEEIVTARSDNFSPDWLSQRPDDDPLKLFVNRWKVKLSPDFVAAGSDIQAMDDAARECKEAEMRLRAVLETYGAQCPYIRKKGTERNIERNGDGAAADVSSPVVDTEPPPPHPLPSQTPDPEPASPRPVAVAPRRRDEIDQIVACASRYARLDFTGAARILDDCRRITSDIPVDAITRVIEIKGPQAAHADRSPSGYLIRTVPDYFRGGDWTVLLRLPAPIPAASQKKSKLDEVKELAMKKLARDGHL